MKAILITAAALVLVGCSLLKPDAKACNLLDIAHQEAQMAEAWYIEAGKVLERCGVEGATERAESKACYARRFNDNSITCD